LIEDERKVDGKVHDNETLGTNAEWQAVWYYRRESAKMRPGSQRASLTTLTSQRCRRPRVGS
jgi:hypothetical protein